MIWNNGILQEGTMDSYPAGSGQGWIYEVLRVIEGIPVFLPEHLDRFRKALRDTGTANLYSDEQILKGFCELIKANNLREGNLRLQAELISGNSLIGIIPHHYPSQEDYLKGVDVELVNLQRTMPNIKTWNQKVRMLSDEIIRAKKIYEVILTSTDGFLTEGSRSNIFGLKKGILITPPQDRVLPGITRQIVIELARKIYIRVVEEPIHEADLYDFQSFFLTGTSPGILPIKSIGTYKFNCKSSPFKMLANSFEDKTRESIKTTRFIFNSL